MALAVPTKDGWSKVFLRLACLGNRGEVQAIAVAKAKFCSIDSPNGEVFNFDRAEALYARGVVLEQRSTRRRPSDPFAVNASSAAILRAGFANEDPLPQKSCTKGVNFEVSRPLPQHFETRLVARYGMWI